MEKPNAIGELNERSLHRALKARYAVPGSVMEQAVDGFVADVVIGGRIVEVHTGSFSPLKKKLSRLLERFAVTLVYPVAQDRYIVTMPAGAVAPGGPGTLGVPDARDIANTPEALNAPNPLYNPDTPNPLNDPDAPDTPNTPDVPTVPTTPTVPIRRRKSPKHDSVFAVFDGLTSIPTLLDHSASRRIERGGLAIPVPTPKEAAVPIAAIYGPNAAGKSDLIDAMDEMRRAIVHSHKSLDATDRIRRAPFRLDDATEAKPTRFDCTFTVGQHGAADEQRSDQPDSVYEYGFECTATEFCKEWLYRIVRRQRQSTQILFERETRDGKVRVKFGNRLPGGNRAIANLTRPNSLFLSAAAQNNHPLLAELYRYFAESWMFIPEGEVMHETNIVDRLAAYEHLERLVELINQADIGINGIDVKDGGSSESVSGVIRDAVQMLSERFSDLSKNDSLKESSFGKMRFRKQLRFSHAASGGRTRTLGYDSESKGTRTLISLLIPALEALSRGSLLVIDELDTSLHDELDTSLHPDLARAFVSLFNKEGSNPRGAQLVFSTHDVTLLGGRLIRQDEIWMTDKNPEGASEFTPLTDFRLRSRDDIERAYRHGRFGGVPTAYDFLVAFDDDRHPAAGQ